jgi:hypothetical protein
MSGNPRQSRDERLIECLARGNSQVNAARLCGCSSKTVARRLENAEFRDHVEAYRADMFEAGAGRIASLIDDSLETLSDLLKPGTSPTIRLAAARVVVDASLKYRDSIAFDRRLAALERMVEEASKGGSKSC